MPAPLIIIKEVCMKKLLPIATILLVMLFNVSIGHSASCVLEGEGENQIIQASFTITEWNQDYYEYLEYWSSVEIWYEITNIGNVEFDFYYVWFDVTCEDESIYHDYDCGYGFAPGKTYSEHTFVDTARKKAIKVEIVDYELTVYDF